MQSSTTPTCTGSRCDHPTPDTRLCGTCVDQLSRDLLAISGPARRIGDPMLIVTEKAQRAADARRGLVEQLLVTMSRQDVRPEQPGGPRDPEPGLVPLPTDRPIAETRLSYDIPAEEVLAQMRATLTTAARLVLEHRHGISQVPAHDRGAGPRDLPDGDVAELALFVNRYRSSIAASEQAGDVAEDVARLVARAEFVVSPREWEYLGPCNHWHCELGPDHCPACEAASEAMPVPAELWVDRGAVSIRCRVCARPYDVAERRTWLLERAEGHLVTADGAEKVLRDWLEPKQRRWMTARRIRELAASGRLTKHAPHPGEVEVDTLGRPVRAARFEVRELLRVLAQVAEGGRA